MYEWINDETIGELGFLYTVYGKNDGVEYIVFANSKREARSLVREYLGCSVTGIGAATEIIEELKQYNIDVCDTCGAMFFMDTPGVAHDNNGYAYCPECAQDRFTVTAEDFDPYEYVDDLRDKPAVRLAFSCWIDAMHRDGTISNEQAATMDCDL